MLFKILHGALVGGPDRSDNYVDDRNMFQVIYDKYSS